MANSSAAGPAATPTYKGSCFCGKVQIAVTGTPVAMGYCHCESCRQWSAAPVNAFTLWAPDAVTITQGGSEIGSFARSPNSHRKWCRSCGGHLFTEHPGMGLVDVYAAVIPQLDFQPAVHVNYAEARMLTSDRLPKFKDLPADMGGSGEVIAS
jgi:hypothetical protein